MENSHWRVTDKATSLDQKKELCADLAAYDLSQLDVYSLKQLQLDSQGSELEVVEVFDEGHDTCSAAWWYFAPHEPFEVPPKECFSPAHELGRAQTCTAKSTTCSGPSFQFGEHVVNRLVLWVFSV